MTRCNECGFGMEGGRDACKARFNELSARDFSDPLYFRSHRLFVDAYCLQHPQDYCASGKSLAAHLAGLCAILERGANPATGLPELRNWLDGAREIKKPPLPRIRGTMTLGDLPVEALPDEWSDAVTRWAQNVWAAYGGLQAQARDWLDAAIQPRPL